METVPVQLIGNKEGSNMVLPTQENGTKIEECRVGAHESGLRGSWAGELTRFCRRQRLCEGGQEMDSGQNFCGRAALVGTG